jgi:DNA-binding transcriptional LysR family regulator
MDLRRLEIFVRVAEFGSFSRAAEALFLTQPTVSEHVRALEDELGVQLLDRLGRGAAPTPAGQLLLGYARKLLTLAGEAQQAVDQFQGRVSGELVVGGSSIPGEYVLPALIGAFRTKHPEIAVSLLIGDSRVVQEWVEAGRVEIGIVGVRPTGRSLDSRQLMADELVVVVAPDHPWVGRAAITVEDIRHEPLILRERGSGSRDTLERALRAVGLDFGAFRIVGEMGSTQAIQQAIRADSACHSSPGGRSRTSAGPACWGAFPSATSTSPARFTWSRTATAAGRRWPRPFSPSSNPSRPTDPRKSYHVRHGGESARPHSSDFLRRLRRLSVQDGSWRSPGGVGRAQASGRSVGGGGAQSARRCRAR